MYKCKLDINMATLKVCQAISRVEICKWIYTQLLTYKPKKWLLLFKNESVICVMFIYGCKLAKNLMSKNISIASINKFSELHTSIQPQEPSISMI